MASPLNLSLDSSTPVFLDAKSLAEITINALKAYGVENLKRMICQCYDGAYVMQGEEGGVRYYVNKEIGRNVPYVHCFNHRLQLVVVSVVKEIRLIHEFFGNISVTYNIHAAVQSEGRIRRNSSKHSSKRDGMVIYMLLRRFGRIIQRLDSAYQKL